MRSSHPDPPPSVSPATPVVDTRPPVVASPWACVARSSSAQVQPAPTRAVRAAGSTSMAFIGRTSITSPSSFSDMPATEWPPERTAMSSSWYRPKRSAVVTSSGVRHWAISAGRRSIIELNRVRASS